MAQTSEVSSSKQEALKNLFTELAANQQPIRVIVGARDTQQDGWVSTDVDSLNLLVPENWAQYFRPNTIEAIMAEHVWEHLTKEQGIQAAQICYQYLQPGGYVRLAVPDGFHPNPAYLDWVRPDGVGPDADDHKLVYDYQSIQEVLTIAGFKVDLLEYFDESQQFHYREWDPQAGLIRRSKRFDPRNSPEINATESHFRSFLSNSPANGNPYNLYYTSIILDAWKQN